MRVHALHLTNYRPFSDTVSFSFAERFTVIAGFNGRGKTAVLDGIALLLSRFLPRISKATSGPRTITLADVHHGADKLRLEVDLRCVTVPVQYHVAYATASQRVVKTPISAELRQAIKAAYGDPARGDGVAPLGVYYTTDRASYRLPKTLPAADDVQHGQAAAYSGALSSQRVNFRDFMARYQATLALGAEELRHLPPRERLLDHRRDNPNYLGDIALRAIAEALRSFLGGFTNLRVQEKPLRLLVDKDGTPLDLSQLSDGERSFLALVCDLVCRLVLANPTLSNPLDGSAVVLIDEIDLHLHPKWQRKVRDNLLQTFRNIQFIGTTHSPFIIQSLKPGELLILEPDEPGWEYSNKSIEDIAEKFMGVDMPQKSERYRRMIETAEKYFKMVRSSKARSKTQIDALRRELDALAEPFSDDPAYVALLRVERDTWLGGPGK